MSFCRVSFQCHFVECNFIECQSSYVIYCDKCHSAARVSAKSHYVECHYAEFHSNDSRGALGTSKLLIIVEHKLTRTKVFFFQKKSANFPQHINAFVSIK